MRHLVSSEVSRDRVANWFLEAESVTVKPTWTERRLAITVGEHTYLIEKDQIYACAHCGHFDPKWASTEVLSWFENTLGIKPHEIEVTCSVASLEKS